MTVGTVEIAKGQPMEQTGTVMGTEQRIISGCQPEGDTGTGIEAGTAADNESVDGVVVALGIRPHDHGAHAMTKECNGESGVLGTDPFVDDTDILYQGPTTTGVHIAQVGRTLH